MPTPVTIPALDLILGSNRMRGRSSPDKWLEHVPEEYRSEVMHCLRHGGSSHKPSADVHVQQLPPAALLRQERFHGNAPAFGKLQPLQYEPPLVMKKEPLAGVVEYKGNIKGEKADGALKSEGSINDEQMKTISVPSQKTMQLNISMKMYLKWRAHSSGRERTQLIARQW